MASVFVEEQTQRASGIRTREFSRGERLQQLERIVSSSHFRNSKRYPSFLRYVVEHTVEEHSEVLKERNLGVEVFGRSSDYDTNADPIVRVTAGEVRKRIAQYYQTPGHENELRIDLPLGSYVPHFHPAHQTLPAEPPAEHSAEPLTAIEAPVPAAAAVAVDQQARPAENSLDASDATASAPILSAPKEERPAARTRKIPWLVPVVLAVSSIALLGSVYALFGVVRDRSQNAGIQYFWQSFSPRSKSALVVIGVHSTENYGKAVTTESHVAAARESQQNALSTMEDSDMVPLSDVISYSKLTDLLTRRSFPYQTRSSPETTLEDLRTGPVLLIGGFNNVWTMRLTSALRYRLVPEGPNVNGIVDSRNPSTVWLFDNLQPAISNLPDYAIVASYYDTTIEQHVVIAAGIGKNGTAAASEFLTTNKYLENWLAASKVPPNKNVELVLSTNVLDGEPGPPHVVASTTW